MNYLVLIWICLGALQVLAQEKLVVSLYFEVGQSALTEAHLESLDSLLKDSEIDSVIIKGYTDCLGS